MARQRKTETKLENKYEKYFNDNEFNTLINIMTAYFNRIPSQKDLNFLIYVKENLGFSSELIEYLLEYCAELKKTTPAYAEKVAKNWYDEKITTRKMAENYTKTISISRPQKDFYKPQKEDYKKIEKIDEHFSPIFAEIIKIYGRESELEEMEKYMIYTWISNFHSKENEVIEACRISASKGKPLKYAGGILKNWFNTKKNVSNLINNDNTGD